MKKFTRSLSALMATGGLLLTGSIAVAPAAEAATMYPTSCRTWISGQTGYALCDDGGGAYQVIAACKPTVGLFNWNSDNRFYFGGFATPGNISSVTCPASEKIQYTGQLSINE